MGDSHGGLWNLLRPPQSTSTDTPEPSHILVDAGAEASESSTALVDLTLSSENDDSKHTGGSVKPSLVLQEAGGARIVIILVRPRSVLPKPSTCPLGTSLPRYAPLPPVVGASQATVQRLTTPVLPPQPAATAA